MKKGARLVNSFVEPTKLKCKDYNKRPLLELYIPFFMVLLVSKAAGMSM